ncbi:1,4-dihydroxy-2-naphthoate polyprenyltransferase [Nesterenkonia sp.]|uniref:1,4-dihydroxy-2-naphthoate polyprenyltransferase n=1 Tax=Nesterenkonia sp. TaxID=704201 RepID=UPI002618533D|nr:1,4-dihydroxy-2-naphthoate polyprenyltransferase [Nesterenkonia sp.]
MATLSDWAAGARPRTLPMAVAPVVIGAAAAFSHTGSLSLLQTVVAALALVVALALQVGVNYANDYSDGVRGTDDARVGPMRLTATGTAAPQQVKGAAVISFAVAAAAGAAIVLIIGAWWMLAVGVLCILAAWWYTGGSRPYGYLGLGEVMVFVFFGLVATLGTAYAAVQASAEPVSLPAAEALVGAVSHGLIASGLLMVNNIRDIPTDAQAGKRTLAVRLGEGPARWGYAAMLGVAVLLPLALLPTSWWYLLVVLSWVVCVGPIRITLVRRATGGALIPVLQQTSVVGLVFAATYSAAMLLS